MTRYQWFVCAPCLALSGMAGWFAVAPTATSSAERRIINAQFVRLEKELGHHLYAPTWLPKGGRIGSQGAIQGARRILQDFADREDRSLAILSQERRTGERDDYHTRIFVRPAEAQGMVNEKKGYFVTGSGGERRLFWNEPNMAVILSSCVLTDEEMLQVARNVR